jgi:hypothetical protein
MAAAAAASAAPPCTAIAALAKFDAISLLPLLPKVLVQSSRLLWWDGLILPDGPIHVTACEKKQAKEQRCLAPPPGHAEKNLKVRVDCSSDDLTTKSPNTTQLGLSCGVVVPHRTTTNSRYAKYRYNMYM